MPLMELLQFLGGRNVKYEDQIYEEKLVALSVGWVQAVGLGSSNIQGKIKGVTLEYCRSFLLTSSN